MRIVTLLSDFGSEDLYVSEMKATVLAVCPSTTLVDISHGIEKFNVRMGAFMLAAASGYFPHGTIHVAVVDPGVGGPRRNLLIETRRAVYVGPDNGILLPAASRDGVRAIYSIENHDFMRHPVSSTFHGRDVFAYTAGKIACGAEPCQVGPKILHPVSGTVEEASASPGRIKCEVLAVDSFGNVVTTATREALEVARVGVGKRVVMRSKGRRHSLNLVRTYSDAVGGTAVLLAGSHGFLEVAISGGNAAKRFRIRSGDRLILVGG
jgi:S-adenosylmethionine hydrolase